MYFFLYLAVVYQYIEKVQPIAYYCIILLQCKHLLAVYLAEALDACKKRVISDEEFVAYMCYDSTAEDNRNKKETFNHRTNPTVSNT